MTNTIWIAIALVVLVSMSGTGGKVQVSRPVDVKEVFR
jgi:hypothetical protein